MKKKNCRYSHSGKQIVIIFTSGCYPAQWCFSRLVTVFKKGQRSLCSNYRGTAVTDSITKLFDCILNNRLKLWYRPTSEQAGAQSGRSCQEQILALRLLIAYAVAKKVKLWLMFVDFTKAYDRVPRYKLLDELKLAGCGKRFLLVLKAMYMCTKFVLRSAIICASAGVKQGAPLSCLFFVFYVDIMIKKIRSYGPDGFLGLLHSLLLMDDTAVVSGWREQPPRGPPWVSGLVGHFVQTWPDSECSHTMQCLDCSDLNWRWNRYHLFWHGMTLVVLMCR